MKKLITSVSMLMLTVFTVTSAFAASVTPISSDMGGDKLAKNVENGAVVKITGDLKHSADNVYYISDDGKARNPMILTVFSKFRLRMLIKMHYMFQPGAMKEKVAFMR